MAKAGFFSGIKDAKANAGGVYFLANKGETYTDGKKADQFDPASYLVKVKKCIAMVNRKKEDLFIVEATIIESDCPERKPGMTASWVVQMKQDAALGNIVAFLAATQKVDIADDAAMRELALEAEELADLAVSEEQPLAGELLKLHCVMIETKAGNPFTLHKWSQAEAA